MTKVLSAPTALVLQNKKFQMSWSISYLKFLKNYGQSEEKIWMVLAGAFLFPSE